MENVKINEILYAIFIFVYEILYIRKNFANTTIISKIICIFGESQENNRKIKIKLQNNSFWYVKYINMAKYLSLALNKSIVL